MGVELVQTDIEVPFIAQTRYAGDSPDELERRLKIDASRRLGHFIVERFARMQKLPHSPARDSTTYRFAVGVQTDMDALEAYITDLARARHEGMLAAAHIVYDAACRYQVLHGGYAPILEDTLKRAAREIENAANKPEEPNHA